MDMTLLLFVLDVAVFFCIYSIITGSLNLQQGVTGVSNLGLYLPILIGAICVATVPTITAMRIYAVDPRLNFVNQNYEVLSLLKVQLENDALMSISLLALTIISAIAVCILVGYLSGYPALRLKEVYVAVFFLCVAETLRVITIETPSIAGGWNGVTIISFFWWMGPNSYLAESIFTIGVAIVINLACLFVIKSPLGRLLRAIRENELAAQCIGKDVLAYKRKVLAFSFSILGVAGVLYASYIGAVIPTGYQRVDFTFWPWLMMILGGQGNYIGGVLSTLLLVVMRRAIISYTYLFAFLPFNPLWIEPILLAALLALTLAFKPSGLLPEKPPHVETAKM